MASDFFTDSRFHDLPHLLGSVDQKAMMELMRHKRPEMTMRYTHLSLRLQASGHWEIARLRDIKSGSESPQISPSAEELKVVNFRK